LENQEELVKKMPNPAYEAVLATLEAFKAKQLQISFFLLLKN
jgi:hypothetical protein